MRQRIDISSSAYKRGRSNSRNGRGSIETEPGQLQENNPRDLRETEWDRNRLPPPGNNPIPFRNGGNNNFPNRMNNVTNDTISRGRDSINGMDNGPSRWAAMPNDGGFPSRGGPGSGSGSGSYNSHNVPLTRQSPRQLSPPRDRYNIIQLFPFLLSLLLNVIFHCK